MARQTGVVTLKGTIGGISFYKSVDGHMARQKGGVDGSRIKTDAAFQRTRENGAEFGRAGKASKLLRSGIRSLLQNGKDRRVVSRLTTAMVKVIQADATSVRGQRNVLDGELELLQGFDFNRNAPLGTTLFAPFQASIDRTAGTSQIVLPPFIPANENNAPSGTTHLTIVTAGVEVDFEGETFVQQTSDSGMMPWDNTASASVSMTHTLTANSTHPIFLLLGVQFYQDVNGIKYPLKNGAFNSLSLVKVSGL
jgi:hypothetical protein